MRHWHYLLVLAFLAASARAEMIDFEDLPAANDPRQTLSEEYAHLGVHFATSDDGAMWDGMSNGDPGGWNLEGSNGSTFVGFDGASYLMVVDFDVPVQDLQLDLARGAGSSSVFDSVQVAGFRNGIPMAIARVYLGAVNDWTTVFMTEEVDLLFLRGIGLPGYRFGVDNLQWAGDEASITLVDIDIKPDSADNPIQLKSRGVVPVVLFGAEDFDVEMVDARTLAFGPGGAGFAHRNGPHPVDVDEDGYLDLVVHHRIGDSGLVVEDVEACLTGETWMGEMFEGCDLVTPVP